METERVDFVKRIKEGYIKRREEDLNVYKEDCELIDITKDEIVDKEVEKYSKLLKSEIIEIGDK